MPIRSCSRGTDVPGLEGVQPDSIVAFKYDKRWRQIPVQVDERAMIDYKAVRQTTSFGAFSHEAYTDPGTFAGADPDPTLDDGDEIAMMAKDAGAAADAAPQPGRRRRRRRGPGSRSTTRSAPAERFIYLFETDAGLDPAAGKSYVDYDFSLDSGDYKTTYDLNGVADDGAGPPANTEDSTVTTALLLSSCSRGGMDRRTSSRSRRAMRPASTSSTATRSRSASAAAAAS